MRDFRRLRVWQQAHRLALAVYRDSSGYPNDERFGLTSQIRRSAISIPSNIAEGSGRASRADYARFLDISAASASELEYQLLLARDLGYSREQRLEVQCRHVRSMLTVLRRRVLETDD